MRWRFRSSTWRWRPQLMAARTSPRGIAAPENGTRLAEEAAIWHDCPDRALILRQMGQGTAAQWIAAAAVVALPTVLLAFLFGQSRIFLGMARDGLLPRRLAKVSSRGVPAVVTVFTAVVVAILAGLLPLDELRDLPAWHDSPLTRKGTRLSVLPAEGQQFWEALDAAGLSLEDLNGLSA